MFKENSFTNDLYFKFNFNIKQKEAKVKLNAK